MGHKKTSIDFWLRNTFLWVGTIGLLLVVVPAVPDVKTWLNSKIGFWISPLATQVGLALLVGSVTSFIVTIASKSKIESFVDASMGDMQNYVKSSMDDNKDFVRSSVSSIKENVFNSVFNTLTHDAFNSAFRQMVLQSPVYRSANRVNYRVEIVNKEINNKVSKLVQVKCTTDYMLCNLSKAVVHHDVVTGIYTRDIEGLQNQCRVTNVKIGPKEYELGEIEQKSEIDDDDFFVFRDTATLLEGSSIPISYTSVCFKNPEHSESYELLLPSIGLDVMVDVIGFPKQIKLSGHIMTYHKKLRGPTHDPPGRYHWRVEGPMLPHQGFYITWTSNA